ncbi:sugar ABC transporter permease [Helcococcus kunzii]|uniref:sugar ABC transporter permease n=1 Tax=Helcococcus kunzii TaxID=40091 RepID=UPI001BAF6CF9|nr:sugar ABC transporter permease [Helcococcus kunzii]MCT1795673.1 sugar ABC transporter permease [Helcococcus kunzii]MCT1988634.1 sugar ABC transporter permease [Helcococcus kunzii]QUY64912.1 sugar ABC transporter permease [Helcococcus kunzii]QZO75620.1 sugar ABC transporter permease [Helcococcus kunzii]
MFKRKKNENKGLYLSDQQPLNTVGKIMLAISYVILIAWAVIIIVPLAMMVISSFNGNQGQYIQMNSNFAFSLKNFKYLFEKTHFLLWVKNTIVIAVATALITLIIVSFTGYAYSRYRFKGKRMSLMGIMLIQIIPAFAGITAYYAIHSIVSSVVPVFSRSMMLILIYAGGGIAGNTFILKGYIDSISMELDDAARIDGCSNFEVYRLIIMPIARPMLAIIALWSFIGPFMDYMLPAILLTNSQQYTLATGLYTLISDMRTMNEPAFAAGGLLTAVPIVILFIALQKQLVSGLSSGSVKG